jgi:peptide/nickel transport system ATP-binding protein
LYSLVESFEEHVLNVLEDLQNEFDLTYDFIDHDLSVVRHISDRVAVMYLGRIAEVADRDELYANPKHPYTIGLMRSVPRLDLPRGVRLETIEGLPPDLRSPPLECRFALRCPFALDECEHDIALREIVPGHAAACIRAEEIKAGTLVPAAAGAQAAAPATTQAADKPLLVVERLSKFFQVPAHGSGLLSS